ncbi:hypothetical protein A0J61_06403 [Choanephora cucurbitarum]|uniref:Uncharacterized protein n=1 Tax=Choanephora cucurbitarum TaxID=101091 RepID=A0A1C7N8Z2_9FUNG|nr:hypothetical protein A0J61_06403 [Choanephora cucurbitarum]
MSDTSKKALYELLHKELTDLDKNMKTLTNNISPLSKTAPAIRETGKIHTAMLMSIRSVVNNPKQDEQ